MTSGGEIWIGVVKVKPASGAQTILGHAAGAFVNALACVADRDAFRRAVTKELLSRHLRVVELEDVEPLEVRLRAHSIEPDLMKMVDEVRMTGEPAFGTFDTYLALGEG